MTALIRPGLLLPPSAYTGAEWLERERRALFDRGWRIVADHTELAAPGAYVSADVGRSPLLLVRGHDGVLRAFHNMCRHRGMVLTTDCGSFTNAIACPYHAWRFGLDGALRAVPQRAEQFSGIELDDWGLLPASVAEWQGMVFASPDPSAPALGDLPRGDLGRLHQVALVHVEGECNWKVFVQHHLDEGVRAHLMFPNLLMVASPQLLVTVAVVPVAPSRSRVELRVRLGSGVSPEAAVAAARSVVAERIAVCEQVQRSAGDVGPPVFANVAAGSPFRQRVLDAVGDA